MFTFSDVTRPAGSFINDVDFDDFIALSRKLGSEPVVMVNAVSWLHDKGGPDLDGLIESAVEWVRYSNVIKKYGVKYWEIGNEVEGKYKDVDTYIEVYLRFSKAMKAVDPYN